MIVWVPKKGTSIIVRVAKLLRLSIVQRYSKRPKQLQRFCLADYVSQVDIICPKGNKLPDKVEYRNDDSISDENSSIENENSEDEEMVENGRIASDLIHIAKNGTQYKYTKFSLKSYAMLDAIKLRI